MNTLIELISIIVISISIPGTYYFIGRIIATRGRWDDTYGEEDRKNIYHNNPEQTTPPLKKKL